MSITLYLQPRDKEQDTLQLVKSAIEAEVTRFELALGMANERLKPFEAKYNVTSDYFIEHLTAEDLAGGDDEYVHWAGEFKLRQRLEEKLQRLQEIEYGSSEIPQSS